MRKNITPSKHWYHLNSKRHITDNLLRQRGYDQLFNTNYGKNTSNKDLISLVLPLLGYILSIFWSLNKSLILPIDIVHSSMVDKQ